MTIKKKGGVVSPNYFRLLKLVFASKCTTVLLQYICIANLAPILKNEYKFSIVVVEVFITAVSIKKF
jgi:hypothetical protein